MNADPLRGLLLRQALSFPYFSEPPAEFGSLPQDGLLQHRATPYFGAAMGMPGDGSRHSTGLREGTLKLHNLEVTLMVP
jgi:hypothetical protein